MIKARLEVGGVNFGFTQELPISTNMSIADIREPEKRQSSFSKTITVPGSGEVKRLFEFIFQINSTLTSFNPNLKTEAKYYVNEVLVFDGALQLLKINNKYVNDYESTTFECSLIGESGNFFLDIAGLYLTDIDFSDLDHTFTFTSSMFAPSVLGTGYAYPYIDYGTQTNGAEQTNVWAFRYLKPAIFEREYLSRMFSDAGYTWNTGGYFDSDYEKRIIIPDVNQGGAKMSAADRALNECYIGIDPAYSSSPQAGTVPGGGFSYWTFYTPNVSIINPIPFDDEAAPYFDTNGRWDSATNYRFTVNDDGHYTVYANVDFTLALDTAPATTAYYKSPNGAGYEVQIEFQLSTDAGATWIAVGNIPWQLEFQENLGTDVTGSLSGSVDLSYLASGSLVRVAFVQGANNGIEFYTAGDALINAGTASMHFNIDIGSCFKAKMTYAELLDNAGQTMRMNTTIPPNVTQLDFITSIIKCENLYVEPSKTVKNQYVIETREDFVETDGNNALIWTDKWDISKPQEVIPMGELDFNRIVFSYKSDKDYYNTDYENIYKEPYGTETIDINNDFIKKEKKIQVVFSPTPVVGSSINNIIAPRLLSKDITTNVVKPIACNIRRLYWSGLTACNEHVFITGSSINYRTTYPLVGHTDNPLNPTVDLCFDNPLQLYYSYPGTTYTNNNRYNERYSKFISEITDPNSKIVRGWFKLTETDIAKFSFSNLVFVRDSYYYVNKIMDYNPQANAVTQAELLKLKAGTVFVPDNDINIEDLGGGDDGGQTERTGNNNNGTGIIIGTGNFNRAIGSFIIGDDNMVA